MKELTARLEEALLEARRRRSEAGLNGRFADQAYWNGYRQALSDVMHDELIEPVR